MSNIVHANGGPAAIIQQRPGEMTMSPAEASRRYQEMASFVASVMVRGVDYGVIPGTGDKPTLLKPGAERLCELYGYEPSFDFVERTEHWGLDGSPAFIYYIIRCTLVHRATGTHVAQGVGSCNSRETKYRYRWVWERDVPAGVDPRTLKSRRTRKGDMQYALENDQVADLANTILKMASKRALVGAVTVGCRVGGLFEQDLEDLAKEDLLGEVEAERSWERGEVDQVKVLGDKLRAAAKEGPDALKRAAADQSKAKLTGDERKALAGLYKELEAAAKAKAPAAAPAAPGSDKGAPAAPAEPLDHDPETGEVVPR